MAVHTFILPQDPNEHTTLVLFSTGRDITLGEQLDLTAQETTEANKLTATGKVRITLGATSVTVNHTTFPAVPVLTKVAGKVVVKK